MTAARDLADRVHRRWLEENPFAATLYGISGYDDRVPDESEAGRQAWQAELGQFLQDADAIAAGPLTQADAVTVDCAREAATQEVADIELAEAEHTVTSMQYAGPATFLAVAARTVLVDPDAAEAYLIRLRRSGRWLDQLGQRLRTGAAKGRLPVAPLAERAISWADDVLASPRSSPVLAPRPPEGWPRAAAWAAERRAEARAAEFFPAPLPPPCEVTPMPEVVAVSGTAPHYTPPRQDGGRPGTFWFNTERPTAGTGWDIEVVAFHEAVPGHHLQLSRLQLMASLPALQRQRSLPVFSEGWGLYAEQLAGEAGLHADERGLLGSISASLMRAARLVVDTGIHAFGWSRERALGFMTEHVPMPPEFLAAEIDRYVVMPGQALAYLTGQLEILRIREDARQRLGPAFSLPAFHGAILDHGSLPMPTLARSIASWLDQAAESGDTPPVRKGVQQ
jgi:uncharacterized protein (DUF885 family)